MGYFDDRRNVDNYINMVEGYNGRELIARLVKYLPSGKSVLELGMGPGHDLDILAGNYTVTGSDNSRLFLDYYKSKYPESDLLHLDAVSLDTDRHFDCIFSNKVLHHLTAAELKQSLERQAEVVTPGGILFHSFWRGHGSEEFDGLFFQYYTLDKLKEITEQHFKLLEIEIYDEMEKDDSIYCILQKNAE